jgi:acylphosphatase
VQGVGFRYFVFRRAEELGVRGWVRNRRDGSVEALIWADDPTTTDLFLESIRKGPRWGRVDRLEVALETGTEDPPPDFEIRRDR